MANNRGESPRLSILYEMAVCKVADPMLQAHFVVDTSSTLRVGSISIVRSCLGRRDAADVSDDMCGVLSRDCMTFYLELRFMSQLTVKIWIIFLWEGNCSELLANHAGHAVGANYQIAKLKENYLGSTAQSIKCNYSPRLVVEMNSPHSHIYL
jgi:hypothetical protein